MKEKKLKKSLALYCLYIIIVLPVLLTSCNDRQVKQINDSYTIVESKPDCALTKLNKINQTTLSNEDLAIYSLVYTIAQDKSGLDVDNDSLIRIAYTYYNNRPEDSLYAKCEYYMGKYYALNDSNEKALLCMSKSAKAAKKQNDYATESMALFSSSEILMEYDPKRALSYAQKANGIFNRVKKRTVFNEVQALLKVAECYFFMDEGIENSYKYINQAIGLARKANDSTALSNAYQDLSVYYGMIGNKASLEAAKKSFEYNSNRKATSSILSLAWAYCDADSLQKSRSLVLSIPKKEFKQYGSGIYLLLLELALKEHNFSKVSEYKDSLVTSMESEVKDNAKFKDAYYSKLISKERQRTKAQNESRFKSGIVLTLFIISIIVIAFTLYISFYKIKQMRIRNAEQQERNQLIIEHQKKQMFMTRNYLISKIDILQKLESLKTGKRKNILLSDKDWEELAVSLNLSDNGFVNRLRNDFNDLTKKDIRFLMLIRVNLPYSTIAQIYHIEAKSVKQKLFLLKKKLGLENCQKSTKEFIEGY